MQNKGTELHYQNEDEINLINLLKTILERKWFIFGLTGLVTLLAINYSLSFTPTYQATIAFLPPSQNSVIILNEYLSRLNPVDKSVFESVERKSIYIRFLTKLSSTKFQKKVFFENDYLTKLNPDNKIIDDTDSFAYGFVSSIKLDEIVGEGLQEYPYKLSIGGSNGKIMSQFLNDLSHMANEATIDDLAILLKLKHSLRLLELTSESKSLLDKAKRERMNEIEVLSAAARMAKSMGIIENNFKQISAQGNTVNLSIELNESADSSMPKWYLFGETALLERIAWLRERKDDSPFVPELVDIEIEKMEIKSALELYPSGLQAMQIVQNLPPSEINVDRRFIIMIGFIIGFIGSIFLVLVFNALKLHDESIT